MGSSASINTAIHCDVCRSQNKASPAVSYCNDCEEKLCQICDNVHRNSKQSKNHTLLTGDNLKQVKSKSQRKDTENRLTKTGADAVPGQIKDSKSYAISIADAVHGRTKDNKSDGDSVPGRTKHTKSDSYKAMDGVKVAAHNSDSVPGRVKDTQTTTDNVSGRVVGKNNDHNSGPGSKLGSSSDTDNIPSVLDLAVSDIKHYNVGCEIVKSAVFMPGGHVVLACGSGGLKLLDEEFKQLSQLSLLSFCVCKVSDTEVLVAQGYHNKIQFVEVLPKLVSRNVLTIGKVAAGVCYHNGEIYVACHDNPGQGEVRVVDRQGDVLRRLGVHDDTYMFTWPCDVKVNNAGDKVFVTDFDTHAVTCMDQSGNVLYTYTDTDLKYPYGMLVDRQDNTLVTATGAHSVHTIDKEGRKRKIILTRRDGLNRPYCISYRHDDGLLAVGMYSEDTTKSIITLKTKLFSGV